jgi:hypothetical protein
VAAALPLWVHSWLKEDYLKNGTPSLRNCFVIYVYVWRRALPPGIFKSSRIGLLSVKVTALEITSGGSATWRKFQSDHLRWKFRYGVREIFEEIHEALAG